MRWYAFRVGSLAEVYVEFSANSLHRGWFFANDTGVDIEIEWRVVRLVISLHPGKTRGSGYVEDREDDPDHQ